MAIVGAMVRKTADQTAADYDPQAFVSWDSAVYDSDSFFSGGAPTRLTVPSAYNGRYGVVRLNLTVTSMTTTASVFATIGKNGAGTAWMGWGGKTRLVGASGLGADAATKLFLQVTSQPVLLTTADYFEGLFFSTDTSVTVEAESSSFGIQILGSRITKGVLAKKAADQTAADYAPAAVIAWDGTDIYDTDTAHDPTTSNSKIIIPSAWNGMYGVFHAVTNISSLTVNNVVSMAIQKGGSDAYDGFGGNSKNFGGLGGAYMYCETQPILLATAEEYEARLYSQDASVTIEAEQSSFGCWIVG